VPSFCHKSQSNWKPQYWLAPYSKEGKTQREKKRNTGGGTWEKEQNILDKREKTNADQVNLKRIPTYKDSVKNNLENSNAENPEVKIPP
jgi:glucan phosphorylase